MTMNDRIVYSNEQMLISLENALDSLKVLRYDSRYRTQLGEGFVEKLNRWEQDIRARKDDPITLVVIGDFKRGKSSFINALLGEEVATTDVTTETVTMNRIRYGAHANHAVLSGSRRLRLEDGELRREALQGVLDKIDEPVTCLELERPCEFLKKVTIIDTPGTDDALMNFDELVKDSLLQADAVLYVYNVNYPLSHSEQLFLKSAVLPQKFTSLFLIGNFADTLGSPESYDRVRGGLTQRIDGLLPDAEVIMVSALDELCRQLDRKRPCEALCDVLAGQFDALRGRLDAMVAEKADTVVVDRMQRLTAAMADDLETDLGAMEEGLKMTAEEAAQTLRRIQTERENSVQNQTEMLGRIDARVAAMKEEAKAWMGDFMGRIVGECSRLGNQDADTLFKYFECFCIDKLQEAIGTCLDCHEEQLYDLLDEVSEELGRSLAMTAGRQSSYSFRLNVDNRIWTKGDTAGLIVSRVNLQGFLGVASSLVTFGIAGMQRSKEKQERVPEIVGKIASQMTGLSANVNETVDKLYEELGAKARRLASEYYEQQLENAERLSRQTVAAAGKKQEEKEQMQATIDGVRALLGDLRAVCQ